VAWPNLFGHEDVGKLIVLVLRSQAGALEREKLETVFGPLYRNLIQHASLGRTLSCAILFALFAVCLSTQFGCGPQPDSEFRLNTEGRDVSEISSLQLKAISETSVDWFGTPDAPKMPRGMPFEIESLEIAAGPMGRNLESGERQGIFRQYCAVCHGISGDGAGPLAKTFDPYPRDFRLSVYKYTSTIAGARALREDLKHTLQAGLPSTGMPAFPALADEEIDALIDYLIYLGIRGETELALFEEIVDQDGLQRSSFEWQETVRDRAMKWSIEQWTLPASEPENYVLDVPKQPMVDSPEVLAASIQKGRELYLEDDAQCVSCHGDEGRGDGENIDLFDDWNVDKHGVRPQETVRLAQHFRLPLQVLRPRDFRQGIFRGGSDPEDLYLRVHAGIKGTPMPGVGFSQGSESVLTDEEIWHLVNYIRSLAE
jgi:mono/diheme cytochrome c family protein